MDVAACRLTLVYTHVYVGTCTDAHTRTPAPPPPPHTYPQALTVRAHVNFRDKVSSTCMNAHGIHKDKSEIKERERRERRRERDGGRERVFM